MSITGKWKLDAVLSLDTNEFMSLEEFVNEIPSYIDQSDAEEVEHEKAQRKMQTESILSITEDGKIEALMPIPDGHTQEEIDAAIAEGELVVKDGMMLIDSNDWKEEDGKLYFSCGTVSFGDGEPETNWEELECEGEKIIFNGMRYIKM